MERSFLYKEFAPLIGMIAGECATVGSNTVYKAISGHQISFYVFTFYTCLAAALVLLPFAFIFRRSGVFPSNKSSFFLRLICLSAMGVGCQLFSYKGLEYSSPTLASAISNLIPALTFILAVLFGMEKLALKSSSSTAKIVGSAVSIAGALVVVLYKGPVILSNPFAAPTRLNLSHPLASSQPNWIMGGLCFFAQYLLNSFWYIILTQMVNMYPDELAVVCLYYVFEVIIAAPICLLAEGNLGAWKLKNSLELVAVLNSGCVGQSFVSAIHTWGVHVKGPVYVSSFRPLSIAIAAATGVIFLGDDLYLGSIIGATIIASGFYSIMWGKIKEEELKVKDEFCSSLGSSSKDRIPLLKSCKVQDD
ncbi:WAT1-related protein At5g40230-like [Cucurbita maxima]|uniref:WAT1-related protein n=1 Tax=Cucurbita maxima TaxID=3661 RepID=A0A6J1JLT9_CUCMA|nr:WAT1-related protein At5g40230-like [Cucurbita maxima]